MLLPLSGLVACRRICFPARLLASGSVMVAEPPALLTKKTKLVLAPEIVAPVVRVVAFTESVLVNAGPVTPAAPDGPVAPCGPVTPRLPVAPVAPAAPVGPAAPVAPRDPWA